MTIYMNVPGVLGETVTPGYENWIEVTFVDYRDVIYDSLQDQDLLGQVVVFKSFDDTSSDFEKAFHESRLFPFIDLHTVKLRSPLMVCAKIKCVNTRIIYYKKGSDSNECDEMHLSYAHLEREILNKRCGFEDPSLKTMLRVCLKSIESLQKERNGLK